MTTYTIYGDLETGGVLPHHPNIQLAAIVVDDQTDVEVSSFERKIQFSEGDADPEALALNHYDRAVWQAEAQPAGKVVALFDSWAAPYRSIEMVSKTGKPYKVAALAGHNIISFDLARFRAMYGDRFFPFSYMAPDTLQLVLWHFKLRPNLKRPEKLKLSVLAEHFGIPAGDAHDALADVRLCHQVVRAVKAAQGV